MKKISHNLFFASVFFISVLVNQMIKRIAAPDHPMRYHYQNQERRFTNSVPRIGLVKSNDEGKT
ncbi:MAG: hypothetical protein IPO48_06710 [Saprospiraceae bacterium]|nr:hypothetical protein [Saprospiraceae bacterium]